ncbi:hypothetical protein [Campylobacter curvus]|jgi:hypothetical protein|uniref:hypothetical protein n=1 Tax=Campylobacter curvus TaxID=200 RepID=UPI00146FD55C|nr:hypothetical protein [Campylobacter curvus]
MNFYIKCLWEDLKSIDVNDPFWANEKLQYIGKQLGVDTQSLYISKFEIVCEAVKFYWMIRKLIGKNSLKEYGINFNDYLQKATWISKETRLGVIKSFDKDIYEIFTADPEWFKIFKTKGKEYFLKFKKENL